MNSRGCPKFENRVYQVTGQFPGKKPFYGLISLSKGRLATETNNIANGHSEAETGFNVQFNVHQGYYDCLRRNRLRITDFGYIYKTNSTSLLVNNGATAIHQYLLTFPSGSVDRAEGNYRYAFYNTGSNPVNKTNSPTFRSPVAKVTCELIDGKNYQWPAWTGIVCARTLCIIFIFSSSSIKKQLHWKQRSLRSIDGHLHESVQICHLWKASKERNQSPLMSLLFTSSRAIVFLGISLLESNSLSFQRPEILESSKAICRLMVHHSTWMLFFFISMTLITRYL